MEWNAYFHFPYFHWSPVWLLSSNIQSNNYNIKKPSIFNYNWIIQNDRKYNYYKKKFQVCFTEIWDLFSCRGMKIIIFIFIALDENKSRISRNDLEYPLRVYIFSHVSENILDISWKIV